MKNYFILKTLSFLVLFIFSVFVSTAQQTGKITGKVNDNKTGEALIGLTVKIQGSAKGVSTDVDGRFNVGGLAAGKYTLVFSYIGYQTKSISDILVGEGKVVSLNVTMSEASGQQLQQVVINVSAKQESIGALYAMQKNSSRISDGISAETIRKSPDRSTSDVLKRVSGATIQENKFVVVRGMGDRYNTALLDGSPLPSTEPNRKAFSFDIIPSSLIDNITISKTATPDLPPDFAGGAVQINTKDIPDQNFISFGLGYSYNTQSTFKDFYGGKKNLANYVAFDDGSKNLPSNFPSRSQVTSGSLSSQASLDALKSLPKDWSINKTTALPGQNYQFSLGQVKHYENNDKLGAVFAVTYRNGQTINPDLKRNWYIYDYNDDQYRFSTNLGALANFAYTYGSNKITLKNTFSRNYDDNYTYRTGINEGTTTTNKFYALDVLQKGLFKTSLEGDHKIGDKNATIKWTGSYSNIMNKQPDQRKLNYTKNLSDANDASVPYFANVTSLGKDNTRLFSDLNDNIYAASASYTSPVKFLGTTGTFKGGLGSQYRNRKFDARFVGMELLSSENSEEIRRLSIDQIFSPQLIESGAYRLGEISVSGDFYDANSLNNFAYFMLDNKLGDKSRIVWGLRAEHYKVVLNTERKIVDDTQLDFLPSVNYTYSLTEKSNLRASYYRTLARPEFRELAPFSFYDYELLANQTGNPDLKRSLIDNADLRYEIYPSAGQIFSVSVFYKHFKDAIESFIYDVNSTPDVNFFNAPKAYNYGVEVEYRKNLKFISEAKSFENTTLYFNFSVIKSKVQNLTLFDFIDKDRPMVGQSPYVFNAGLQHSALDNKLNFNLLYNRLGRRIYKASGIRFGSIWEAPRDVIDFQISYKAFKEKGEFKLNGSDLLNAKYLFYFDNDNSKKYNSTDEVFSSFKPGTSVSLSFAYTF